MASTPHVSEPDDSAPSRLTLSVSRCTQEKRFEDMLMEMRKMKAVIVKHDDKIQKLEARLAANGQAAGSGAPAGPTQLQVPPGTEQLAPDEV